MLQSCGRKCFNILNTRHLQGDKAPGPPTRALPWTRWEPIQTDSFKDNSLTVTKGIGANGHAEYDSIKVTLYSKTSL